MSDPESRLKRARIAAVGWGVFLLAITSWPQPPEVPLVSAIPEADKLTHFLLYAVESFFLYRAVAWPGAPGFSPLRALAVVGTLAVWGTVDEIHQLWIPGRAMEGRDLLADIAGGAVGALLASALSRRGAPPASGTPLTPRPLPGGEGVPEAALRAASLFSRKRPVILSEAKNLGDPSALRASG